MNWILINCFILICLKNQSIAHPATLEDGILLRRIAGDYSASLVASLLHSRIQNTAEMMEKIKNSFPNLNLNQQNLFTLKVKSLEALDQQLNSLQKTEYFGINGTERVKYLIEQYILTNEIFPTQLGSDEGKFNSTPDELMKKLNIVSNDQLINDTNDLINMHLNDLEEKASNVKYNQLQRLAASVTKRKLVPLVNFKYEKTTTTYYDDDSGGSYHYGYRNNNRKQAQIVDNRASQIESVLRRLKSILDLFYSQFANLASQNVNLLSTNHKDKSPVQVKKETKADVFTTDSTTQDSSSTGLEPYELLY